MTSSASLSSAIVVSPWSNDTNMIIVNMPLETVWLTSSTLALWSAMVVATCASSPWLSGPSAVTMTVVRIKGRPGRGWAASILNLIAMPSHHGPTQAAAASPPGRLDRLDRALSRRLAMEWPHPRWFTFPLSGLSLAANYGVLWYVLCLVPWLLGAADPLWKALYVAVPVTLVEMTGYLIKQLVGRARPPLSDPTQPEQIRCRRASRFRRRTPAWR